MASWDDEIDLPFTDDEGEFRYSDYDLLSFSMLSTGTSRYQYCRFNFLYRYWFIIYTDFNTSKLKLRQCTCKSKSITG